MNKNFHYILFVVSLFVLLSSCKTIVYTNTSLIDRMSEKEVNIKSYMVYLEATNPDCKGECDFTVENEVFYFDDCMPAIDSARIVNSGYNSKKEINMRNANYNISNVGVLNFSFVNKFESKYRFAPIVYIKDTKTIYGQVRIDDKKSEFYVIKLIGDEFIFSSSWEYYFTCAPWY